MTVIPDTAMQNAWFVFGRIHGGVAISLRQIMNKTRRDFHRMLFDEFLVLTKRRARVCPRARARAQGAPASALGTRMGRRRAWRVVMMRQGRTATGQVSVVESYERASTWHSGQSVRP